MQQEASPHVRFVNTHPKRNSCTHDLHATLQPALLNISAVSLLQPGVVGARANAGFLQDVSCLLIRQVRIGSPIKHKKGMHFNNI
jgi:hypothetical protein